MTKTVFTATDAAGVVHKRTTENRHYTHTVVVTGGYEVAMANAKAAGWAKSDASSFDHYKRTVEGRDPYMPSIRYRAKNPDRWTATEIAEEEVWCAESDAKKLAIARLETVGRTVEQYVAIKLAQRIKRVEERKAAGDFDTWKNAGWCGRRDLAEKLAAKHRTGDYVVAILEAREA